MGGVTTQYLALSLTQSPLRFVYASLFFMFAYLSVCPSIYLSSSLHLDPSLSLCPSVAAPCLSSPSVCLSVSLYLLSLSLFLPLCLTSRCLSVSLHERTCLAKNWGFHLEFCDSIICPTGKKKLIFSSLFSLNES